VEKLPDRQGDHHPYGSSALEVSLITDQVATISSFQADGFSVAVSISSGRQSVVPHQQGQDEGRREEVATNLVWTIHHLGKYWKQCLLS